MYESTCNLAHTKTLRKTCNLGPKILRKPGIWYLEKKWEPSEQKEPTWREGQGRRASVQGCRKYTRELVVVFDQQQWWTMCYLYKWFLKEKSFEKAFKHHKYVRKTWTHFLFSAKDVLSFTTMLNKVHTKA